MSSAKRHISSLFYRRIDFINVVCSLDNCRFSAGPSPDACDFRMLRVTDDQNILSVGTLFSHNIVDLFYKWTCRIYDPDPFFLQLVVDPLFYSVGTDDHGSFCDLVQRFFCTQYDNPLCFPDLLQPLHCE